MTAEQLNSLPGHLDQGQGLDITVRTGSGAGRTALSAFDRALQGAGVADFNLITLSSVIPTGSRVRTVDAALPGGHGDALFCVRSQAFADTPGETVWAGLGWCTDASGGGLFVEHRGTSEQSVVDQIEGSLADMNEDRGGGYGQVQIALASATCLVQPVCALVLAAYRVSSWNDHPSAGATGPAPLAARPGSALEPPSAPTLRTVGSSHPATTEVTVEHVLDDATVDALFELYELCFAALGTQAAARHLLTASEFREEMTNQQVAKYVARDDTGRVVGLSTLTADLDAVPWISPSYFRHRHPEHAARGAIYYMGFTLVHPEHRGARTYQQMFRPMVELMVRERAVAAWDICAANDHRGLGGDGARLLQSLADVEIEAVDHQTYYSGTFFGPPADDSA